MSQSLRVAMIVEHYLPSIGGMEHYTANLAQRLQAAGCSMTILTTQFFGQPAYECQAGLSIYRLPFRGARLWRSPIFMLTALHRLMQLQPDIIHAHQLTLATNTALLAKRLLHKPIVATTHSSGYALGDVARINRSRFHRQRIQALRQNVDLFIASAHVIETELDSIGIFSAQRTYIPAGIDVQHFKPSSIEVKRRLRHQLGLADAPTAIFTGRLVTSKRVDQLLRSWPAIQHAVPTAQLVIIGSGPEANHLQDLVSCGVKMIDAQADVAPYLQAADVFVLPSASEALSIAMLEAMSVGLPVIVTDVGGLMDAVTSNHNGLLIPPDDQAALQKTIIELLRDPDRCAQLGQQARQTIVDRFSLERLTERMIEVYQRVNHHHHA